jgi:hypothetical protein
MQNVKAKLKNALNSIEAAITHLRSVRKDAEGASRDVANAIRELEDAEAHIRRSLRELPAA